MLGIVNELVEADILERSRVGRRNVYTINRNGAMRHPTQSGHGIGALLDLLAINEDGNPAA